MEEIFEQVRELAIANRILAREGVVDAFGHISMRHPKDPERFLLSRSRAPELITPDDIMEFQLDGTPVDLRGRTPYGERFIHAAVLERRPDVNSVVHNHSLELLPFSVTSASLRPLSHVCCVIGAKIPTWDIADKFGETDMLVVNMEQGRDLAATLGGGTVSLMRGHGSVCAANNVKEAVMVAVYLQVAAKLQLQALQLGTPKFLSDTEIVKTTARQFSPLGMDRAWDYWVARADVTGL